MPADSAPREVRFRLNDHEYRLPAAPVVAICIDGCANEYLDQAFLHGVMPRTVAMLRQGGYRGLVRGALPSFTNVNNASVICGAPPCITGISGNFFLDPDSGQEVMMNAASYLRSETILAKASAGGRQVAMVTAKDKLRTLLARGLDGICFSAEKADQATLENNKIDQVEELVGAPTPSVYSGELSLFALRAGATLLEQGRADFLYLTLSDYVQHKHAPHETEALDFYAGIDAVVGRCLDAGAVLGITADHGMNGKTNEERPNIIFLEEKLSQQFGPGNRVICTITDPYVVHHGALGGFVTIHLADPSQAEEIGKWCLQLPGIAEVHGRQQAAWKLELPEDRIGDLVVLATRDFVIGRTSEDHDLSLLGNVLRSHGSRYEEMVPLLTSTPLNPGHLAYAQGDPRSFDLFRFLCPAD